MIGELIRSSFYNEIEELPSEKKERINIILKQLDDDFEKSPEDCKAVMDNILTAAITKLATAVHDTVKKDNGSEGHAVWGYLCKYMYEYKEREKIEEFYDFCINFGSKYGYRKLFEVHSGTKSTSEGVFLHNVFKGVKKKDAFGFLDRTRAIDRSAVSTIVAEVCRSHR